VTGGAWLVVTLRSSSLVPAEATFAAGAVLPPPPPASAAPTPVVASTSPTPSTKATAKAKAVVFAPSNQIVGLIIPKLHVSARIYPVGVSGDQLQIPSNPANVGWWVGGAKIGANRGTALIDGHVAWAGRQGALFHLTALKAGDRIWVASNGQLLVFQVTATRTYPKDRLPVDQLTDQAVPGRLALISCSGLSWDPKLGRNHYYDNIVVYASRVA
jgi:sortase (surface protein transpeptidase)